MATEPILAVSAIPRTLDRVRLWFTRRLTERTAVWILALALCGYVSFYTFASVYKYETFRQGIDLAQNEQTIWNTSQGRWFQTSLFVNLRYDFDDGPVPFELLLAVPYAIFPSTFTLLFLQTVALASGAIPLFLLARNKMNAWIALCFGLAYLFHVTVTRTNMYEFQLRSFVLAFFLLDFYFFAQKRFGWFLMTALLMLSCKTEVGFTLPMFGLYALFERRNVRWILTPIVMGTAWLLFVFGYVIPTYVPTDFIRQVYGYSWLGNNFREMFVTIVTRPVFVIENVLIPGKVAYLWESFLLLLFLPLLSPRLLILALPNLGMSLLAASPVQYSVLYFYQPFVIGTFFLAAIYGCANNLPGLVRTAKDIRLVQFGIAFALTLASIYFNLTWNNLALRIFKGAETIERRTAAERMIAQVPTDAPVAASLFLGAHMGKRQNLYYFPGNKSYPFPVVEVQYVLVDLRQDTDTDSVAQLKLLRQDPHWQVAALDTDYLMFRRN